MVLVVVIGSYSTFIFILTLIIVVVTTPPIKSHSLPASSYFGIASLMAAAGRTGDDDVST